VVSPTNFWQVAPIVTRFIESQPIASQTTNITAARNLHIHSIAISTTNVTNTIALPTTNSFNGDIALVVHQGPTSSVTAVRTAGAATNLVTLNQFEEAVEFVYYNNVWQFNHNPSFTEPIFFSGTNAADHAAASRTNLGLGATNDVSFKSITSRNDNSTKTIIIKGDEIAVQSPVTTAYSNTIISFPSSSSITMHGGLSFSTNTFAGTTRTNLGLGATNYPTFAGIEISGLDEMQLNGASIDAVGFGGRLDFEEQRLVQHGAEIFAWNTNSFAVTPAATFATNVTVAGSLTATSTITAKTNMVVEGFVDFTTNRTNNSPAAGANFGDRSRWLQVKIGTNNFYIPLFQ
jgi:hypothetical protein